MSEPLRCRHLLCDQEAGFLVTVNKAGASKTVRYCTKHLTRAMEAVANVEGATLTNVRPIEKGTTVTEPNPERINEIPLTANDQIDRMQARARQQEGRIANLEAEIFRQGQVLSARNKLIADLEHDNSEMKATLRNRERSVTTLLNVRDALVGRLHVLADNAEDEGQQDLAEEVDALLAEYDLKPRKQEYTIEILVPTRLHLHVTASSMNHARTLYEAGDIDWNVADGEIQDDDIKVLDISEGSL